MLNFLFKLGCILYRINLKPIAKFVYYLQCIISNSSVPHSVKIGAGSKFAYGGIGTVIHARVEIGEHCIIGQGITIGGRSKHYQVPVIGNNVYIGAGSRILGPIKIGDNSIIAPNAVVIEDVRPNTIVGGIPSRVIKNEISVSDYI